MSFINNEVTRTPNGVSDQNLSSVFNSVPFGTKALVDYYQYFNDFMNYLGATEWTITNANGGTLALRDEAGGVLRVTNGATATWLVSAQKIGLAFAPTVGKRFFGRIKVRTDDVTNGGILAGLALTDTTPLDATDGIYIIKNDAAATVSLVLRKDATTGSTSLALGSMVVNTWFIVDLYYDGVDRLYAAVNGSVIGYVTYSTAYVPDTPITPTFFRGNGAAGSSELLDIDTLWFAQER
jgi:hypothetical protein